MPPACLVPRPIHDTSWWPHCCRETPMPSATVCRPRSRSAPMTRWCCGTHLANCSEDRVECNASNLERRITTVDAQNSEVWIRVAVSRYARGDDDAALDAVRRAAAAGESRIYWPETMEAAYRALNAAGGFDATNSAILAHGLAASDFPRYQEITNMCRDQSAVSYDWALACLDYGRTSQKQSRADLAVLVGYFVQESALEALRDDRELARVKQQREAFRSSPLRTTTETEIRIVDSFVMTEPGLFAYLGLALRAGTETLGPTGRLVMKSGDCKPPIQLWIAYNKSPILLAALCHRNHHGATRTWLRPSVHSSCRTGRRRRGNQRGHTPRCHTAGGLRHDVSSRRSGGPRRFLPVLRRHGRHYARTKKNWSAKDRPNGSDDDAFPSGHASTAFQGAAFLHRRYGIEKAWLAYGLAAYTGWTRIDADEHDAGDVLAGAAVGILSSVLFVERFENVNVSVRLDDQIGLQFSGRFE